MAIRSRVVRPDSVIETLDGGQMLVMSREAIVAEVVAAVDTMLLVGGEFTVSSQRAPTGFAHESVSVAGFITWRSATARTSKAQPEPHVEPQAYVEPDEDTAAIEAADADDFDLPERAEDDVDRAISTAVA